MIRKNGSIHITQTILDECSDYMFKNTDYKVEVVRKEMNEGYDIPDADLPAGKSA
jgi:hypothetical protein